jgi:DNA-binding response OmpR family regulator
MSDVVLVEDDPDLQVLTSMLLESHGHVTRAFSSGQPALQACFVEPPEVVLLDWMLPEMTGIEILRELRANPTTAHVPVVMVTAQDRPENIATAFDNGASDFVRKPFTGQHLLSAVERQLGSHQVPAQAHRRTA